MMIRFRTARGRPAVRRRAGFTLAEVIVSFTLLGFVMSSLVRTMVGVMRSYGEQTSAARSAESLRATELLITRVLRSGRADLRNTGNALITPDPLAHGSFDNVRVRSDLNSDGDLADQFEDVQIHVASDTMFVKWSASGSSQAAAYPVRSIGFEYFSTGGTAITTSGAIPTATRARLTIVVPETPTSTNLIRRQAWVYLRN